MPLQPEPRYTLAEWRAFDKAEQEKSQKNRDIVGRALVGRRFTPEHAEQLKHAIDRSTRPL